MKVQNMMKLALIFLIFITTTGCNEETFPDEESVEVRYVEISSESITLTNNLPGRVSALVVAEVRPQVDGIILERLFEEGSDVEAGQVLYQIDPAIYRTTHEIAKAALAEAEANAIALAMLEKRYRDLAKVDAISRQELDNAISDNAQAQARVARARAELESSAIKLAYTQIKAPVSGRIGASSVTTGALVTANQSTVLAVIQQTERVYVDFSQSSADTIRLRRAMAQGKMSPNGSATKVRLTLEDGSPYTPVAYNDESNTIEWIYGDLLFSEISVGQMTGSVSVRAVFQNPDGLLLPGMYVQATIEEGAMDNAVLIPQASVLSGSSGEYFVFILQKSDPGKELFQVERRNIILDRSFRNRWIVKSGLATGELLLVEGLQKALPGRIVKGVLIQDAVPDSSGGQSETKAR